MTISPIISHKHKLAFIKFEDIFEEFEIDLLDDLNLYGLLKNNVLDLRKRDTKSLLYHHIIYNLCECIISIKKEYKVDVCIVYNQLFPKNSEICQYIDCNKLYNQIITLLKNIQTKLYIPLYKTNIEITQNNIESGEVLDILNIIITKLSTQSTKKNQNFSKISEFANKHGLKFLNEEYFRQISTKYLLI